MTKLRDLPGLGPKSEQQLMEVSIKTPEQLKSIGAVGAFLSFKRKSNAKIELKLFICSGRSY